MTIASQGVAEKFIEVDGNRIRYLEAGSGVPAIMLHGASLGSTSDVFRRNFPALAAGGIHCFAVDYPGFGKSHQPKDLSGKYRQDFVLKFADAIGLDRFALIAHSQSCNPATAIALENPDRVTHLVLTDALGLMPPLPTSDGQGQVGGREAEAIARIEERMMRQEPTPELTRALLEQLVYDHSGISDEELRIRHENSIGECYTNFVERRVAARDNPPAPESPPLWQRLEELKIPVAIISGKQDRARTYDRVQLLIERYPSLPIHVVDGSKHIAPWDKAEFFEKVAIEIVSGGTE